MAAVDGGVSWVKPSWQIFAVDEPDLSGVFWHAEMRDAGVGESTFLHNAVAWNSRPTRLDRQTSYTLTQTKHGTGHGRITASKAMRLFALDVNGIVAGHCGPGDLDHGVKEPRDAAAADRIVGRTQTEVFGDVFAARGICPFGGVDEHLGPYLIEFGHRCEDTAGRAERQFRGIIFTPAASIYEFL